VYDPQLLALLDLPAHAGLDEIKQRFRALAKRHHPDLGGSSDDFRALMEVYERLTEGGTQG
jgi:curved DNA-binding protein CbpA